MNDDDHNHQWVWDTALNQDACLICGAAEQHVWTDDGSVEVEIEFTFVTGSYDRDPQEFFFDAGEWMEEHGWRFCLNAPDPGEIACPEHEVSS